MAAKPAKNLKQAFDERKAKNPAATKKAPPPDSAPPPDEEVLFVRVKPLKRKDDHFPASCVEIVRVKGATIVERKEVSKPDVIEMTVSIAEDILEHGYHPEQA